MSHELEITKDGSAKFAYAITGGVPWHKLGTPLKGLATAEEMLKAAQADYEVKLVKVVAVDDDGNILRNPDGSPVIIEDSRATVRANNDGTYDGLATVGTRYTVKQNVEVAERALAVVGASKGDAVVDTAGVLANGARFFMTIDLGPLVIDPTGVNDRIARFLVVSTGHDGVWPVRYANTDIRAVCNNTVRMGLRNAQRVFVARHTRNIDSTFEDAQRVLEISTDWAREFQKMAERMLRIPVPASSNQIDRVLDVVFPAKKDETERQKRNRDSQNTLIRAIYESDKNAGGFGHNGWAIYNAVGEYLDHHREADPKDRAIASLDDNSWVTRTKVAAQEAVLALV
jgi:phage/plasmid-like protein (TIGR03299 family)